VALDPLVGAVRRELSRCELAVVVRVQHLKLAAALLLRGSLVVLDGIRSCPLGVEKDNPHVAGCVVDEEEEVASSSKCSRCHGAAKVAVHKLQLLLGAEACLAGKGHPSLPGVDTGVAELLHVVVARHALHHLLVAELLQGLEVEVPKALVPPPGFIVPPSCKTKGLRHLCVKNVEAVAPPIHLGKKSVTRIPNAKHAVLDLYARAFLIQLSQADDGVPQRRDVVDAG
jgi:hypothetical protein